MKFDTSETSLTVTCQNCDTVDTVGVDPSYHIGRALLEYACSALHSGDTNRSILFSAMAIDCYLSQLYYKWRDIEELDSSASYDLEKAENKILEELNKIRGFLEKAKAVEGLMHPKGITDSCQLAY